jgi:hypothetical protein
LSTASNNKVNDWMNVKGRDPRIFGRAAIEGLPAARSSTRKPSKYRNRRTTVYNITFDSKREANRYLVLKADLEAGKIANLKLQVTYRLVVNETLICSYRADFVYEDLTGATIVEDAKGMRTKDYVIKKKLMKALFGIDIRET